MQQLQQQLLLMLAILLFPSNNLGQESSTVRITGFDENGTTQKDLSAKVKATGYRNSWSYVGSDCTSAVDSTFY